MQVMIHFIVPFVYKELETSATPLSALNAVTTTVSGRLPSFNFMRRNSNRVKSLKVQFREKAALIWMVSDVTSTNGATSARNRGCWFSHGSKFLPG